MMEHNTDRLFWTISTIIVAAILLMMGVKGFPSVSQSALQVGGKLVDITTGRTIQNDTATIKWTGANGKTIEPIISDDTDTIKSMKQQIQALTKQNQQKDNTNTGLQNTINQVNAQNENLNRLFNQQTTVAGNQNTVDGQTLNDLQQKGTDLYNQLQQQTADAQSKLDGYQQTIDDATKKISDLTDQINALKGDAAANQNAGTAQGQASIEQLTDQLSQVNDQLTQTQNSANQIKQQLQQSATDTQNKLNDYQNQLNLSNNTISTINNQNQALKQNIATIANNNWNMLTPDQQADLIKNAWDQLSWPIKDSWAPSHFDQLTQDQREQYAAHNYAGLSDADKAMLLKAQYITMSANATYPTRVNTTTQQAYTYYTSYATYQESFGWDAITDVTMTDPGQPEKTWHTGSKRKGTYQRHHQDYIAPTWTANVTGTRLIAPTGQSFSQPVWVWYPGHPIYTNISGTISTTDPKWYTDNLTPETQQPYVNGYWNYSAQTIPFSSGGSFTGDSHHDAWQAAHDAMVAIQNQVASNPTAYPTPYATQANTGYNTIDANTNDKYTFTAQAPAGFRIKSITASNNQNINFTQNNDGSYSYTLNYQQMNALSNQSNAVNVTYERTDYANTQQPVFAGTINQILYGNSTNSAFISINQVSNSPHN